MLRYILACIESYDFTVDPFKQRINGINICINVIFIVINNLKIDISIMYPSWLIYSPLYSILTS